MLVKTKAFLPVIQLAEVASHPACERLLASGGCGAAPALAAEACGLRPSVIFLFHIFREEGGRRGVGVGERQITWYRDHGGKGLTVWRL